jgi:hypothetical protein
MSCCSEIHRKAAVGLIVCFIAFCSSLNVSHGQTAENAKTPLHELNPPELCSLGTGSRWGYGFMWWVWDAPNSPRPFEGAYTGMGAGG